MIIVCLGSLVGWATLCIVMLSDFVRIKGSSDVISRRLMLSVTRSWRILNLLSTWSCCKVWGAPSPFYMLPRTFARPYGRISFVILTSSLQAIRLAPGDSHPPRSARYHCSGDIRASSARCSLLICSYFRLSTVPLARLAIRWLWIYVFLYQWGNQYQKLRGYSLVSDF